MVLDMIPSTVPPGELQVDDRFGLNYLQKNLKDQRVLQMRNRYDNRYIRGHDEMTQVDDMFINYYDSKKTKKGFLLQMVILLTKKGYSIFVMKEAEEGGAEKLQLLQKILKLVQLEDLQNLAEGTGSLALAGLEKLNFISDGSVEKFGEFFAKEVYPRIGETETLAGGFNRGHISILSTWCWLL